MTNRGVRAEDLDKAIENARAIAIPHNREVLHVIPRTYAIDGSDHVRSPLGMHGSGWKWKFTSSRSPQRASPIWSRRFNRQACSRIASFSIRWHRAILC